MKTGPKSKTLAVRQEEEIRNSHVKPLFDMLVQHLEELKSSDKLDSLVYLVIKEDSHYNQECRAIPIDDDFKQQDVILLSSITDILKGADKDDITYTYNILAKLLHEFRFNKNPNSMLDNERNAVIAAQTQRREQLYEQSITIIGTLAERVQRRLEVSTRMTPEEVDKSVVKILRQLLTVTLLDLKKQEKPIDLTVVNSETASAEKPEHAAPAPQPNPLKRKLPASSEEPPKAYQRLDETKEKETKQPDQEQADRDYAQALQRYLDEEGDAPARGSESDDEDPSYAVALQFQMEEFNRQVPAAPRTSITDVAKQLFEGFRKRFF